MKKNKPITQTGPIYWELRNGEEEITASGYSESIKKCLTDIAIATHKPKGEEEVFIISPGLYIDGSPNRRKTKIIDKSTTQTNEKL